MWFVTCQKHGASALGLQRVLGLESYRTAWAWLHKMRRAMVIGLDPTVVSPWAILLISTLPSAAIARSASPSLRRGASCRP
jgi:hypothetical protein